MTCAEHGEVVVDLARGLPVDQQHLRAAAQHASQCPRCATEERDQRSAQRAIRALAEASASLSAPGRVETALLAAFRARGGAPLQHHAAPRPWEWYTGLLAVAATLAVVLGAALVARLGAGPTDVPDPPPAPASGLSTAPPLSALPPPSAREMALAARAPQMVASPATARAPSDPATAGFLSLPWTGETTPRDTAQLVRIRVSRASLAALGLPIGGDDLSRTVDAEILIGDDGLARAIRVVDGAGAL